jgi:glutaminase
MEYQELLNDVYKKVKNNKDGKLASYIPQLAKADPSIFGITFCDIDGNCYSIGDYTKKVPIESISKLFSLALAVKRLGKNEVYKKIGTDGSFMPFNSIIAAKLAPTHTINPYVNQGAMATTSLLYKKNQNEYKKDILDNLSNFANNDLHVGESVYKSESSTNTTNMSLAYLLKSLNRFYAPVEQAVDAYTYQCSVKVSAKDLAIMASVFANAGKHPLSHKQLLTKDETEYILNTLKPEGLYEYSPTWMVKTDGKSYAKSGVGGGILIVIPNVGGIGIVSPKLDKYGNSVRGIEAGIILSNKLGKDMFRKKKFTRKSKKTKRKTKDKKNKHL